MPDHQEVDEQPPLHDRMKFCSLLAEYTFITNGFATQESEQAILEDGGIELWLGIVAVLKISKYNNTGLGLNGIDIFVWFND